MTTLVRLRRRTVGLGLGLALGLTGSTQAQNCTTNNFCSSTPNSTGSPAIMSSNGDCVVPNNNFTLLAGPVPDQFGVFFYSDSQTAGGAGVPFGNGLKCVAAAGSQVYRLPVVQAVGGMLAYTVDFTNPPAAAGTITAGSTWYFQAWFRDPAGGGSFFNLSDGLGATFRDSFQQYNILNIIIDDVGIEFLRIYDDQNKYDGDNPLNILEDPTGANLYPWTPFISELASKGIRFNQFHVNPTCSTTRAAMYTGRYAFRNGVGSLISPDRVGTLAEFGIGPGNDEWVIAQVVESAGYRSGFLGKWHLALTTPETALGGLPGYGWAHALNFGAWDEAWITHANLEGPPTPPAVHVPGVSGSNNAADDVIPGYYNYYTFATFGSDPSFTQVLNHVYATERERELTLELVDLYALNYPGQPWFITSSFNAAHSPYGDFPDTSQLTTTEYWPAVTPYGLIIPGGSGTMDGWTGYCALIEALDSRLQALFDSMGGLDAVLEDTMVFVMGENGSPPPTLSFAITHHGKDLGSVYPFIIQPGNNHFKHEPYEQGTKVPLLVAGPLVANPGRVSNAPIDGVDVHATFADLAGATITDVVTDGRAQDGRSFRGIIEDTLSDAQHIDTVRDFCFVERFSPNGDPRTITPPISNLRSRRRGYMGRTANGWFKLIRHLRDSGLEEDELYQLYDTQVPSLAGEVDTSELTDLMGIPAYVADYTAMVTAMEALLATEP